MPRKAKDITGMIFGRLTVIKRVENAKNNESRWLCSCECGNFHTSTVSHLNSGDTRSCGCLFIEGITKHGKNNSAEYHAWEMMIDRCFNTNNKNYHHYGGRGISVCDEWKDFKKFYRDMGDRPSKSSSIDRIDNNLGYYKENCRWATRSQQMRNYRLNNLLTFNNETRCVSEWAEITGINKSTISKRVGEYGWSVDRALSEMPNPRNRIF